MAFTSVSSVFSVVKPAGSSLRDSSRFIRYGPAPAQGRAAKGLRQLRKTGTSGLNTENTERNDPQISQITQINLNRTAVFHPCESGLTSHHHKRPLSLAQHRSSMAFTSVSSVFSVVKPAGSASDHAVRPQQFLNFLPLPHGHGSLRPTLGSSRLMGSSIFGACGSLFFSASAATGSGRESPGISAWMRF
jgi:hypothetical protein